MTTNPVDPTEADLRARAIKRIEMKQNSWRFLGVWVVLSAFFTVIWLLSDRGYFWPVWPIVGTGVAVVFSFLASYAGSGVTESRIDAEVQRMRDRG